MPILPLVPHDAKINAIVINVKYFIDENNVIPNSFMSNEIFIKAHCRSMPNIGYEKKLSAIAMTESSQ